MATGVTCSVVQLAHHPPPVHLPVERVALPTPIPSHHVSRRPQRESHGGFRWHRPAFQPFQLKPWARDLDVEVEMRESLAVIGPHKGDMPRIQQRSLTAPPVTVSSLDARRDKKLDSSKTAQSSPTLRELLTPVTKRSVATFPARPPLCTGKQVPGRFFPKPTLTEDQKTQLENFRRQKPRKAFSIHSATPSQTVDITNRVNVFDSSASSVSRMDRQHSPSFNQRIARTRQQLQKERPELRSEVFAICFKQDLDNKTYDPHSELHSDYYSIKRLKMPAARLGQSGKSSNDSFAVVLRGHRKHLHKKLLLSAESTESLVESLAQAARSSHSLTRRSPQDERASPRKVIDIETPKADRESEDQSDVSGAEQEEPDNTLAPLNSPTDQKDAFPALV